MAPQKRRDRDAATAAHSINITVIVSNNIHHNNYTTVVNNGNNNSNAITTNGLNGTSTNGINSNSNSNSASNGSTTPESAITTTVVSMNNVRGGSGSTSSNASTDSMKIITSQQEHELFLQAFEKPTQIYRFLRDRHLTSPIFLARTLSYMKDRMSRSHKNRATFKVDSLLDCVDIKKQPIYNKTTGYLNILFFGVFHQSPGNVHGLWNVDEKLNLTSTLFKITKNQNKNHTTEYQEILSFNCKTVFKPSANIDEYSIQSLSLDNIDDMLDYNTIYKLFFRIEAAPKVLSIKKENGDKEEPTSKRLKMNQKIFGCELTLLDLMNGIIPEGEYEAGLQELVPEIGKIYTPKRISWETIPDEFDPAQFNFEMYQQQPKIKFRITLSTMKIPQTIAIKDLNKFMKFSRITAEYNQQKQHLQLEEEYDCMIPMNGNRNGKMNGNNNVTQINYNNNNNNNNTNCITANSNSRSSFTSSTSNGSNSNSGYGIGLKENIELVFNFLYSNNTRQQTQVSHDVHCPWCKFDCLRLIALMKHLKYCHSRFNFIYQPVNNGARIDVTINDAYDGSYSGSPYDLASPSGCSFARTCGPVRRTSVTQLLFYRPRRQTRQLDDEFLELDEDDMTNQRSYMTGHNRLYHHTETCLPVHPKELDIDSEGESDPLWLRQKTIQMIDEFSDVNEGEKELMKLWNLHMMKHGFVGDCQLPLACEMFLDENGYEIIQKNLYRNFNLHLCSLFDYGLISAETYRQIIQKLQSILSKDAKGQEMMSKLRESQLSYWQNVGVHKQEEQKLKAPPKIPLSSLIGSEKKRTTERDTAPANKRKRLNTKMNNNNIKDRKTKRRTTLPATKLPAKNPARAILAAVSKRRVVVKCRRQPITIGSYIQARKQKKGKQQQQQQELNQQQQQHTIRTRHNHVNVYERR